MDAKYRFFNGQEENSNSDQTKFHNAIDQLARALDCVIVLIHHSTKGDQGGKQITDVGSGGGAQSRTVDCHLVIRPHEDGDQLAVLDAAVRTFAPVEPQTIRWEFPLWATDHFVQPVVKQVMSRGDSKQEAKDAAAISQLANIFHEHRGTPLTQHALHTEFGSGKVSEHEVIIYGPRINEIARHPRFPPTASHQHSQPKNHVPPRDQERRRELLREQFGGLGDIAVTFLEGLLQTQRNGWHQAQSILALLGSWHRDDLLAALQRAITFGAYSRDAIERILAAKAKPKTPLDQLAEDSRRHLDESLSDLSVRSTLPAFGAFPDETA